jgi:hypothetical protein
VVPADNVLAQQAGGVEAGRQQFDDKCAVCHGATGIGDGVLAEGLRLKPADLTRISERNGGTFPTSKTFSKIWGRDDEIISTHNMSEMPAFYDAPVFGHDKEFEASAGRLTDSKYHRIPGDYPGTANASGRRVTAGSIISYPARPLHQTLSRL